MGLPRDPRAKKGGVEVTLCSLCCFRSNRVVRLCLNHKPSCVLAGDPDRFKKNTKKKQCIITAEQNSVSSRKCIVLHGMFAQHTPSTQKGLPICLKHNLGQFCSVSPSSLYLLSSCGSASLLLDKRWEEQDKPSTALHYT